MRSNEDPGPSGFDRADDRSGRLERIVSEYVDQLINGETIDFDDIVIAHPDVGEEVVDYLRSFVDFSDDADAAPFGTLGDFTLRRRIGRGGMGVVYEAWQGSMERTVALKVLPAGIAADTRACARFMREAQAAGKLSHQNVVSVHSMGVEKGTPYYSMEYVDGETLAQIIAKFKNAEPETETPFGPKDDADYFIRVARTFAEVAEGVQHAHSKGVIHRDIKPSNLILDAEADQGGRPKGRLRILDFGLARLEGQESLTLSGDFVGTPLYMSPEQARRRKIPVDHRTDIFSLGVTMYEMLTWRPPFQGKDHQDTLSQIIERDPTEPRKSNPKVPEDLETVVLKCLRKEPEDRYGTAEALGQDLRRFVRGDPIEARPQGRLEKLGRRLRRYRLRIAIAGSVVCVLVALAWVVHLERTAEEEWNRERYEKVVLEAIKDLHGRQIGRAGVRLGDYAFAIQSENPRSEEPVEAPILSDLREIAEAVPERPEASFYLARLHFRLGEDEEARRRIEMALEASPDFAPARLLAERLAGGAHKTLEEAIELVLDEFPDEESWQRQWLLAQQHTFAGRPAEAAKAYGRLILWNRDRRSEPSYAGSTLEAHMGRGLASIEAEQYGRAIRDFQAARTLCGRFPEATLLLGRTYSLQGDAEEAESIYEEFYQDAGHENRPRAAFLVMCARGRKGSERWIERLDDLGRSRFECRWAWFAGDMEGAYEIAKERILREDPYDFFGLLYGGLALTTLQKGMGGPRWEAARFEMLEIGRRIASAYPNSVPALSLHSACLRAAGDADGALAAAERALRTSHRLSTEPASGHIAMAQALLEHGDFEAAEKHARAAQIHLPNWLWRLILAQVHEAAGRYDEAAERYRQLAGKGWDSLKSWPLSRLAGILLELGDYEEAAEVARQATKSLPRNNSGHEILALALQKGGHLDEALEATAEGIESLPERTRLHRIRAELLEETGDPAGAAAALVEALYLEPSDEESHARLQELLERNINLPAGRRLQDLEERLKERIRRSPSPIARRTLDWIRGREGSVIAGSVEDGSSGGEP